MALVYSASRAAASIDTPPVAIKLLLLDGMNDKLIERFRREAAVGRGLTSQAYQHLLRVHPASPGQADDTVSEATLIVENVSIRCLWYAMEYLDGNSLEGEILDPERLIPLATQVCEALQRLHREGIIHRDVKPQNIVHTPSRGFVLIDYGLAFDEDWDHLTKPDGLVGTLGYFHPELEGAARDILALGVTLVVLATGAKVEPWKRGLPPDGIHIGHLDPHNRALYERFSESFRSLVQECTSPRRVVNLQLDQVLDRLHASLPVPPVFLLPDTNSTIKTLLLDLTSTHFGPALGLANIDWSAPREVKRNRSLLCWYRSSGAEEAHLLLGLGTPSASEQLLDDALIERLDQQPAARILLVTPGHFTPSQHQMAMKHRVALKDGKSLAMDLCGTSAITRAIALKAVRDQGGVEDDPIESVLLVAGVSTYIWLFRFSESRFALIDNTSNLLPPDSAQSNELLARLRAHSSLVPNGWTHIDRREVGGWRLPSLHQGGVRNARSVRDLLAELEPPAFQLLAQRIAALDQDILLTRSPAWLQRHRQRVGEMAAALVGETRIIAFSAAQLAALHVSMEFGWLFGGTRSAGGATRSSRADLVPDASQAFILLTGAMAKAPARTVDQFLVHILKQLGLVPDESERFLRFSTSLAAFSALLDLLLQEPEVQSRFALAHGHDSAAIEAPIAVELTRGAQSTTLVAELGCRDSKRHALLVDIQRFLCGVLDDYNEDISLCGVEWLDFELRIKHTGYVFAESRVVASPEQLISTVLSVNLYHDPLTFVRELVQNAADAVRIFEKDNPPHPTSRRVQIDVDASTNCLRVTDKGIGMNLFKIRKHLARVGFSFWKQEAPRFDEFYPIGQFGIGILSCFLCADYIQLITRMDGKDLLRVDYNLRSASLSVQRCIDKKWMQYIGTNGTCVIANVREAQRESLLGEPSLIVSAVEHYFPCPREYSVVVAWDDKKRGRQSREFGGQDLAAWLDDNSSAAGTDEELLTLAFDGRRARDSTESAKGQPQVSESLAATRGAVQAFILARRSEREAPESPVGPALPRCSYAIRFSIPRYTGMTEDALECRTGWSGQVRKLRVCREGVHVTSDAAELFHRGCGHDDRCLQNHPLQAFVGIIDFRGDELSVTTAREKVRSISHSAVRVLPHIMESLSIHASQMASEVDSLLETGRISDAFLKSMSLFDLVTMNIGFRPNDPDFCHRGTLGGLDLSDSKVFADRYVQLLLSKVQVLRVRCAGAAPEDHAVARIHGCVLSLERLSQPDKPPIIIPQILARRLKDVLAHRITWKGDPWSDRRVLVVPWTAPFLEPIVVKRLSELYWGGEPPEVLACADFSRMWGSLPNCIHDVPLSASLRALIPGSVRVVQFPANFRSTSGVAAHPLVPSPNIRRDAIGSPTTAENCPVKILVNGTHPAVRNCIESYPDSYSMELDGEEMRSLRSIWREVLDDDVGWGPRQHENPYHRAAQVVNSPGAFVNRLVQHADLYSNRKHG